VTAAARRFPLTSDELADAVLLRGKATSRRDEPVDAVANAVAPSLYERTFVLTDITVLRGHSVESERSLTFKGYTPLPPAQRLADTRSPTLDLDGQTFFDRALTPEPNDVALIVGGPGIATAMGQSAATPSVVEGPLKGSAVRAFLAAGADDTLPASLPLLVGFRGHATIAAAEAATRALHPIVAVDALRQAARLAATDQVEVLAGRLLHPSEPVRVKTAVVELLAEAIREVAFKAGAADRLVEVAAAAWEAERGESLYPAYLRTLLTAGDHTRDSALLLRLEGLANDSLFGELSDAAAELLERVKERRG
jgi:hypothetical protein